MNDDVLVRVDHVSKKFCRDLKKSLWYGIQDISSEIMGSKYDRQLRPEEFWSVDNVSFELRRGECLGLIGPNGAGKSTLLKMLNGLIKPDKGRIEIRGRVGALIELGAGFNPILTGRENIYANGSILGLTVAEIEKKIDAIVEFSELGEFMDTPVQNYSSGMRVRLGFAVAAQMEPDVLIIDEVLAVGDVGFRAKCFNAIYKMIQNAAVILVSHSIPQISRVCSDILVMNHGKCEFQGNDVAKGIEIFYSYFQGEEITSAGSGRAKVYEVDFESQGQTGVEEINYLDELIIHIDFQADSEIKFISISTVFVNQELQEVAQCISLYNNFKIPNSGERMKVSLNLGQINFNPGLYSFIMSINEDSNTIGEVLLRTQNMKKLKVKGNFYAYVPIQIMGEWKLLS